MTFGAEVIEGVVLCQVGAHRLAVRAGEVTSFADADGSAPYAGVGFDVTAVSPQHARLLRHHGAGLVVDSVEVNAERLRLMPVPPLLTSLWGGALAGFIEVSGHLWPLVSLARLTAGPEAVS